MFPPRPHTRPPDPIHIIDISSERLMEMDNIEIVNWAMHYLHLMLDVRMPKQKLLNELMRYAQETFNT